MKYDMLLSLTNERLIPHVNAIPLFSKKGGPIYLKITSLNSSGYISHNVWSAYVVPDKISIIGIVGDIEAIDITDSSTMERFDKFSLPFFQSKANFIWFIRALLHGK